MFDLCLILALVIAFWMLLKASQRLDDAKQENRALDLKLRCEQEGTKRLRHNQRLNWAIWESRELAWRENADLRWHLAHYGSIIHEQESELARYRGQRDARGRFIKG